MPPERAGAGATVSATLIVRDEERFLEGCLASLAGRVDDRAAPEHVVHEEQATGTEAGDELLGVGAVARLVGIDEGQVDHGIGRERPQRLDRRGDAQVDAIGDAGRLPVAPADRRPLVADVARDHAAALSEPAGQAQGRVAGERPDLDDGPRPDQPGQQGHERALLRRDLHHRDAAELLRLGDQRLLMRVGRRAVGHHVRVQLGREREVLGVGHGARRYRPAVPATPGSA